jgi:hypothetical protein
VTKREINDAASSLAADLNVEADLVRELAEFGFQIAEKERKPRLIIGSHSREKRGKTHFALTSPPPIGFVNIDRGTEGVIEKFKDIPIVTKTFATKSRAALTGDDYSIEEMNKDWDEMQASIRALLRSPFIRTVVVDTGSDLWEACRLAHFGTLDAQEMKGKHITYKYGAPNREFKNIIDLMHESDKNCIITNKVKNEYVNDKRTGKKERAGFNDLGFMMQLNIEHLKDEEGDFGIRIDSSRDNPEIDDEELWGPACCFYGLAKLALPGTKKADWFPGE